MGRSFHKPQNDQRHKENIHLTFGSKLGWIHKMMVYLQGLKCMTIFSFHLTWVFFLMNKTQPPYRHKIPSHANILVCNAMQSTPN